MITFKASLLFLIIICAVKSDVEFENQCKDVYTDLNNTEIDVSKYCSEKMCIKKCCGENKILLNVGLYKCVNKKIITRRFLRPDLEEKINYSNILSSRNREETSKQNLVFIGNRRNLTKCTVNILYDEYKILQDGSISKRYNGTENRIKAMDYCLDFQLLCPHVVNETCVEYFVSLVIRANVVDPQDAQMIRLFELITLPISSFFLLLVFVVYCLLPELQNLIGRVLMAYLITMLSTFVLKWLINLYINHTPPNFCKIISPCMYFTALSCFFWFNVMSYDVWWGLRGHRKMREINRRGERVKFMWYCLYAWGVPLLMTIIVTVLDNSPIKNITKPPFQDCLHVGKSFDLYFKIPIGILIFMNTVLFTLTVYNIWMIRRAISMCADATINKKQTVRFFTYFKLFAIMGISWCLELLPSDSRMWAYILTSMYNILTGVAIFFLFVFKKKIFIMLCRKFSIFEEFTKKLELSKRSRGASTSTTKLSRGSSAKNSANYKNRQLEPLQSNPKGE